MEMWRPIPAYEGYYEASTLGRIRSLRTGTVLSPLTGTTGYRQVNLHRSGRQKTLLVHRLVMLAFVGPAPVGMEVRHKDGIRSNNTLSNLAYGTHLDNMQDQRDHGTHRNSVKTHCPEGHPYQGDNLLVDKNGHRRCAVCRRESWLRVSARRRAARKGA